MSSTFCANDPSTAARFCDIMPYSNLSESSSCDGKTGYSEMCCRDYREGIISQKRVARASRMKYPKKYRLSTEDILSGRSGFEGPHKPWHVKQNITIEFNSVSDFRLAEAFNVWWQL
jgi:hypothetical protein